MNLSIIIPAHNEEKRIERTLRAYAEFFKNIPEKTTLLVVLNACTDDTLSQVHNIQKEFPGISYLDLKPGGKGFAIRKGFVHALESGADLIGFVDADMATSPQEFYKLVQHLDTADGVIASRYMPGSIVVPPRPFIKRWGSKLFYEPLIRILFGMNYYDYQCGAKVFKKEVIAKVTPELTVDQWAFDVELLYLCKKYGFTIKEVPTQWHDQADSKLNITRSGLKMVGALFTIYRRH
jgi:glycosyltransferase involved in cell wall biosynthesis